MACQTPDRGDSAQLLLFKIASCCFAGGGSGVTSFNSRTGEVTLLASDVTPVADDIYVNETGDSMSGLLTIDTDATSLQAITSDAGVANTPETIQIFHKTSAVPATGFGNRLQFYADTDGGSDQIQARIDAQWVDAVDATRSSRLVFGTRNTGGVISSPLILTNGQLQLLDGTAAIPTLSFQSDTDVGIFRAAADTLGFSTGGSERVRIDSAGFVGIGTTNPLRKLVVQADLATPVTLQALYNADTTDGNGVTLSFRGDTSGAGATAFVELSAIRGQFDTHDHATRLGSLRFFTAPVGGSITEKLTILGSGNIGVGTSTPSQGLTLGTALALAFNSGANQRAGDVVLIAGTRTVANTTVTVNTRIYLTRKVSGGTIGFAVTYTVIAATSFTITSDNALDTSTYSFLLIEVP